MSIDISRNSGCFIHGCLLGFMSGVVQDVSVAYMGYGIVSVWHGPSVQTADRRHKPTPSFPGQRSRLGGGRGAQEQK